MIFLTSRFRDTRIHCTGSSLFLTACLSDPPSATATAFVPYEGVTTPVAKPKVSPICANFLQDIEVSFSIPKRFILNGNRNDTPTKLN